MLVDYIIAMSEAVCRFRELTALLGLLLDNIPIKGIKFCGCRGLRFILLLEEAQETALLLSFLRTLICYDGNTLGKFFAEFYLLFKQLEILKSWISFSAINTRRLSIRSPE